MEWFPAAAGIASTRKGSEHVTAANKNRNLEVQRWSQLPRERAAKVIRIPSFGLSVMEA